ncbi:60S ribosomal protein L23 [Trifolium medium]|uniref:60S ribosomal protein L23 n=1 Tax=Trifolium medium TaxID=97028 RepID=A0A392N390_9FABA|nr:60S ribosomal protein L23 [Trifolium medium]
MNNANRYVSMVFAMIDDLDLNTISRILMVRLQHNKQQRTGSELARNVWTRPARGTLKCYVEQNLYCVGACIRDENGLFVQAFVRNYAGKPLIAEVEAKGLLEVLHWLCASNRVATPIVIEMDCLQVVQAIGSRQKNNTEFGAIIDMCSNLLVLEPSCIEPTILNEMN